MRYNPPANNDRAIRQRQNSDQLLIAELMREIDAAASHPERFGDSMSDDEKALQQRLRSHLESMDGHESEKSGPTSL